ncbi:hypothetical protein ACIA8C_23095 [Nocardia sp. NPDC051321]|uniref:hypothetical protein n=1 Tax=Nocardia sp. NPDC051321 TaxID=3364323 RepID=UPI0037AF3603
MTQGEPIVAAIVGIDGAGKSTAIRLVGHRLGAHCAVLSSMRNHEVADAPLRDLSLALDRLRTAAEELGSQRLKLASLYLQMCIYGPTEQFVIRALAPSVVLSDRHPIIDAAVYLPLFRRMIESSGVAAGIPEWRDRVSAEERGLITRWMDAQNRRLGTTLDLTVLTSDLMALADHGFGPFLAKIAPLLQATLPQRVLWLDLEVEQALQRLASRQGPRELHETRRHLMTVRAGYLRVLENLPSRIRVSRIEVGDLAPEQVVEALTEQLIKDDRRVHTGTSAA